MAVGGFGFVCHDEAVEAAGSEKFIVYAIEEGVSPEMRS